MKLLTKEIENKLPKLYSNDEKNTPTLDQVVVARFFNPVGPGTWWAIEGQPCGDDFTFYGIAHITTDADFGYFSLNELQSLELPLGMGIERDICFSPTRLGDIFELKEFCKIFDKEVLC